MKKGFTLIELLAVVIVLAVISVVATPIIIDVVEDAKASANRSSVYGIIDSAKLYYAESMLDKDKQYNVENINNIYDLVEVNGEKPSGGKLYVNSDGQVAISIILNNKCYIKDFYGDLQELSSDDENCDLGYVSVDENKPTITLEITGGEVGNDEWYVKTPYVKIHASDSESGLLNYKWCQGNNCEPNNLETENGKTISVVDSKEIMVCAIAYDKALNESEKVCTDILKVDTQAPEISGIADIKVAVLDKVSLTEGVEVSDTISEVEGTYTYLPESVDTSKTGTTEVIYTVLDKAGNKKEITRKVTVSALAPTITYSVEEGVINSNGWAKSDFYVTISVKDNTGHGLKEFRVCTATTDTCNPVNGSIITDSISATRLIAIESNNNRICVQATDNTNQTSDVVCSDAYKLDKTVPTVVYNLEQGYYNTSQTITITPSDDNYDYMNVHVYKDDVKVEEITITNSTYNYTISEDGNWVLYTQVYDKAGNKQQQEPNNGEYGWYYQGYIIDTTEPTLELSKETYIEGFEGWVYGGGAYEQDGIVYMPKSSWLNTPLHAVNNEKWDISFDVYAEEKNDDPNHIYGAHGGSCYYDENFQLTTSSNGYQCNGWAQSVEIAKWETIYSVTSGFADDVKFANWNFQTGSSYATGPVQIKNFKIKGQLYQDFYNITIKTSDLKGIEVIKYAFGEKDESYFESNGIIVTTNEITVTENGTHTVYAKDKAGNEVVKTITIDKIDKTSPIITAKSATNKIKLGDSNEITSYFNINKNGEAAITQTTCINKTDNSTITNTSSLTAGTHTIECKVLKANNKTATATTNISVIDYGTEISSSYDALYSGIDSGSLVTSEYLIDGNAKCCGNMISASETLSFQRLHNGPEGTSVESVTYTQDYINIVNNTYFLEKTTGINRWVQLYIHGGYQTYGVEIGNLKLKFEDGNEYTLEESVQNGYIEPLIIISAYASEEVWLFKDSFNLYNGGTTGATDYGNLNIIFKISSKSKMIGFNLNSSKSFGRDYADGFHVYQFSENFEISIKPW